jgi:hypothetical protein
MEEIEKKVIGAVCFTASGRKKYTEEMNLKMACAAWE